MSNSSQSDNFGSTALAYAGLAAFAGMALSFYQRKANEREKKEARHLYKQALGNVQSGWTQQAVPLLQKSIEKDPTFHPAFGLAAWVLAINHLYLDSAENLAIKAIQLASHPNDKASYTATLAEVYIAKGALGIAIVTFHRALDLLQHNLSVYPTPMIYYRLAQCYSSVGDFDRSFYHIDRAIQSNWDPQNFLREVISYRQQLSFSLVRGRNLPVNPQDIISATQLPQVVNVYQTFISEQSTHMSTFDNSKHEQTNTINNTISGTTGVVVASGRDSTVTDVTITTSGSNQSAPIVDELQVNRTSVQQDEYQIATRLRLILLEVFDPSELQDLCFEMGIDYENLAGQKKSDKIRELIDYCRRYNRTRDLIDKCRQLRPNSALTDFS